MEKLINQISNQNIQNFFRGKSDNFKPSYQDYSNFISDDNSESISEITNLGSIAFENRDELIVVAGKWNIELTERSSKLRQYKIAKNILKSENKDAAFFIFYDGDGNFRFSLIRVNFLGIKRDFTDFKRYTYFVSPKQTNKTFINQISKCNFNSLDSIQDAFSVEPITKQFYEKLQRWYFWAIQNVKFPEDAEAETNGREVAIIRLITRLMFIWFMKVRNLIPDSLFDARNISKILKDVSAEESTYYKAILQNLFFATLNTEQKDRKFRNDIRGAKGYNPDYGNHNAFRYQGLFNEPEFLDKLFGTIPFLNGGLFECLDYKSKDKNERKYIDGFTDTKEHQPKVPNFLFFSEIEKVDISSFFGTNNKTYEVEGLINLLNSYNFTIDENEPDDIEVALDPELLGSIFENLLASYNPETATTARKATGSFYTPREIVNYMTNESLKQYLRQGTGRILLSEQRRQGTGNILLSEQTSKQDEIDTFFNPVDEIIIKQGKLPHWTQENSWYFITFRLADSIPKQKVEQLKRDREAWVKKHKGKNGTDYTKEELKEYYYLFSERVENWMNAGYGKCVLKDNANAQIVANALKYFEGKRYKLDEWVVMPNHVHLLVKPFENYSLSDITHSWKSFTANEINKNINSFGQLWMHESYDHIVRNEKAFRAIKKYIRENPAKAGMVSKASSFQEEQEQATKHDALDTLFDSISENPFDEETTKQIIEQINNLRVVDPAVGSGAFPMAMLNKLVFILGKLDPENKHWKQSQIDGVKKSVSDSVVQRKLIEQIERQFKEKNADYGRKLYLIEKCIYGVDIQQIAVEIAKLRFFISLLVDEKIDWDKPENNYEIEPLPNLDFKLMQGNSLISTYAGIDFYDEKENPTEDLLFDEDELYKKLIKDFEDLKHQYQNEADNQTKKELRKEIDKAVINIFEEKISSYFPELKRIEENAKQFPKEEQRKKYISEEKRKLTKKLGFDIEQAEKDLTAYTEGRKAKDFFLWNVYFVEVFSEKSGFDIVIGNPPYIEARNSALFPDKIKNAYQKNVEKRWLDNADLIPRGADLLIYFFEFSLFIMNCKGINSFITQNAWLSTDYGKKFQNFLLLNRLAINIEDSNVKHFNAIEGPNINTVITFISNGNIDNKVKLSKVDINRAKGSLNRVTERYFEPNDELLKYKWGTLFKSPDFVLEIFSLITQLGSKQYYSIGQGLNLTKSYLVDNSTADKLSLGRTNLLSILTSVDGAPYVINRTEKFLINRNSISSKQLSKIENFGIDTFVPLKSRKIPSVILPRGLGRYFAAFNTIDSYSSSYVEIYTTDLNIAKRIWLFLNSSIGYLIREITGRSNLGGGMLKAEATDLKYFPLSYSFNNDATIEELIVLAKNEQTKGIKELLETETHKKIDKEVFKHFGIKKDTQDQIIDYLLFLVLNREAKSKS